MVPHGKAGALSHSHMSINSLKKLVSKLLLETGERPGVRLPAIPRAFHVCKLCIPGYRGQLHSFSIRASSIPGSGSWNQPPTDPEGQL